MTDPRLCYVSGDWAYFTTQEIDRQWGDDWNDAPYEHNAGRPYAPFPGSQGDWTPDGKPRWEIVKIAWEGPFDPPSEGHWNSPWSVEKINAGATPWLRPSKWSDQASKSPISIMAGTTLVEFCELMRLAGGTVYLATELPQGFRIQIEV